MPRKMVVRQPDGSEPVLTEVSTDEAQLQELVKKIPDLISVEEFGMVGPMMVVGRETSLPSGSVDLVGLTQIGEILVIEFKTGPQNPDFRHALSQLVDYGSDLWSMTYEEFEEAVPLRYFASNRCDDPRVKGKSTLEEAMLQVWPDSGPGESTEFRDTVTQRLKDGHFDYVVIAQRFTAPMLNTIDYMNNSMPGSRFYAVELVKFESDSLSVFETRTTRKPTHKQPSRSGTTLTEVTFMEEIENLKYKEALQSIFHKCRGAGLKFPWGTAGTSIRASIKDGEPISVGWAFPPGRAGWMGLTDLTLGYEPKQIQRAPEARSGLERFVQTISSLPDTSKTNRNWLDAYTFTPGAVVRNRNEIVEALTKVAADVML